ncbi:MAG: PadR family transcriptional regulator [Ruminococcus sp.]|jgi:DNA-binding PadR family transcriptional regulator|nr:PadR family transcriptional regulator [Ruminococcus sp.]
MLKHGILGLINYHEMTGYEIMQAFRDSLNFFWKAQTSQIYRELQTLENKKWVTKTFVPQKGKPDKNIYSITEEGRRELLRWLADGDLGMNPRTPVLMKVFFMGEQTREENIRYFEELKSYCSLFLESLTAVPEHIEAYSAYIGDKEKALYWGMTVEYGRRNMQMCMDWAQSCIEQLERDERNESLCDQWKSERQ